MTDNKKKIEAAKAEAEAKKEEALDVLGEEFSSRETETENQEGGNMRKLVLGIVTVLAGALLLVLGIWLASRGCDGGKNTGGSALSASDRDAARKLADQTAKDKAAAEVAAKKAAADLAAAKKKCGKPGGSGVKPPPWRPPPMRPAPVLVQIKAPAPPPPKTRYIISHPTDGNGGVGVSTIVLD